MLLTNTLSLCDRVANLFSARANKLRFLLQGGECGPGTRLYGSLFLRNRGRIEIGEGATIRSGPRANAVGGGLGSRIVVGRGANLSIGNGVGLSNIEIWCSNDVRIGSHTMIGGGARIYDTDFHSVRVADRTARPEHRPANSSVVVGSSVFIGAYATILAGSRIGDGAVIGAGAVIRGDVPSGEVWAGNPARRIGVAPN